jgi:hypothetical protein
LHGRTSVLATRQSLGIVPGTILVRQSRLFIHRSSETTLIVSLGSLQTPPEMAVLIAGQRAGG